MSAPENSTQPLTQPSTQPSKSGSGPDQQRVGVTAPQGFRAAGVTAGLKQAGTPDVAVVINEGPVFAAAGVFTSNRVKAAPVRWCESVLSGPGAELTAVVLNSGGANACTGPVG
ncbi:MAG TPA: bifunctional ornithine acetyltransferase/N-acetylglutamate synthase, partial [Nakamurella sp.]